MNITQKHKNNDIHISNNFDIIKATSNITDSEGNTIPNNAIFIMMKMIQKHSNYKIMQQHKPLTNIELIALIIYTYSHDYCRKMKQSRDDWYCNASNAVAKLHSVLHYKNEQQQPNILFHGTSNPSFDQFSKEELYFKTFCSFTTEFSVAQKFATGSMLVITHVDKRIRSGQLKGADVSWISPYHEYEWILLPTTFYSWREMRQQEIIANGWKIEDHIKVYITDDYESNINTAYHINNIDIAIKHWFHNELGFRANDCIKYFDLFINNGYNTFELIQQITYQDLNNIGIIKIAHINSMLKKIKVLDSYLNNKQNVCAKQLYQIMRDIDQHNDEYSCYRRKTNRYQVICKCEWIHHDTIPINQFALISEEDRQHIAGFHPDLHCRLNNKLHNYG